MAVVKAGHVRLASTDGSLELEVMLDEQPPTMVGGYAGLERIDRRYRLPIIEWTRGDAYTMTFGLLFDGYRDRQPVDADVNVLEQMARVPGGEGEPPVITADGPLPRSRRVKWRIEQLEFGDSIWSGNARLRQQATVTLVQHEADERLARLKKPKLRRHRVKANAQTAERIAAVELGKSGRWREIDDLNPKKVKGPKKKIPIGTVLRLPPR